MWPSPRLRKAAFGAFVGVDGLGEGGEVVFICIRERHRTGSIYSFSGFL